MEKERQSVPIRLGEFILENMEPILMTWEDYAREYWKGEVPSVQVLRNDAEGMLRAVVADMETSQDGAQQKRKSEGVDRGNVSPMNDAAVQHALSRLHDGFNVRRMVAEFRALRASVNRLWWASFPVFHSAHADDMCRFNEALDQLVAESLDAFTERMEQNRKLFLAMLGHDLRQPLVSMRMFHNLLSKPGVAPEEAASLVDCADKCRHSAWLMMNDLLDFATTQIGAEMPLKIALCDLRKLAERSITEIQAAFPDRRFTFEADGDLLGAWDEGRLAQLLSNLLCNSSRYGDPTKPISLRIRAEGDIVSLVVENYGKQIPPGAIGTLFDPLVRLPKEKEERPHGTIGLGLYICREIARAHGGEIGVESNAEGLTAFTVTLPALAAN